MATLCMQLEDVPILEHMLSLDHLAFEGVRAPHACILEAVGEVLMHGRRRILHHLVRFYVAVRRRRWRDRDREHRS